MVSFLLLYSHQMCCIWDRVKFAKEAASMATHDTVSKEVHACMSYMTYIY